MIRRLLHHSPPSGLLLSPVTSVHLPTSCTRVEHMPRKWTSHIFSSRVHSVERIEAKRWRYNSNTGRLSSLSKIKERFKMSSMLGSILLPAFYTWCIRMEVSKWLVFLLMARQFARFRTTLHICQQPFRLGKLWCVWRSNFFHVTTISYSMTFSFPLQCSLVAFTWPNHPRPKMWTTPTKARQFWWVALFQATLVEATTKMLVSSVLTLAKAVSFGADRSTPDQSKWIVTTWMSTRMESRIAWWLEIKDYWPPLTQSEVRSLVARNLSSLPLFAFVPTIPWVNPICHLKFFITVHQ